MSTRAIQAGPITRLVNDANNADIVVFSATDVDTLSWELDNLRHGAFTYAVIQGLEGKAARKDGSVTVLGLGKYVPEDVTGRTNDNQQPTSASRTPCAGWRPRDAGMKEMSIAFALVARNADVALSYYSGHAMQFGIGCNGSTASNVEAATVHTPTPALAPR